MSIHLITGAMFSGKTSALLRPYKTYNVNERVLIKHVDDIRFQNNASFVFSHIGEKTVAVAVSKLGEISTHDAFYNSLKLIAVDEGHFFDDIYEYASQWALHGKNVIITGLCRDILLRPLPAISRLIAVADDVTFLTSKCSLCTGTAGFNYQKTALPETTNLVEKYRGTADDYSALCRTCFYKRTREDCSNKTGMFIDQQLRIQAEQMITLDITKGVNVQEST